MLAAGRVLGSAVGGGQGARRQGFDLVLLLFQMTATPELVWNALGMLTVHLTLQRMSTR